MTVIIGTGNAVLDAHIKKYITSSAKVNYLEELQESVVKVSDALVVVLSSFLPSVQDETTEQKAKAFISSIQFLLQKGIRVVFLTDTTFPTQDLQYLFDLGIYDFIITEDGNVDLQDILDKVKQPTSVDDARSLIESFGKKQNAVSQRGNLQTVQDNEFYQHMDYKTVETPKPFSLQQPLLEEKEEVLTRLSTDPTNKPNRQKTNEKSSNGKEEEAKIFTFWGASTNLGKRTLSQSYAMQIAKMNYSVLYVEFDYQNSALALTTALSSAEKNFYQLSLSQDSFDIHQFIANKMDVKITKDMLPLFNEIPMEFNFLGLPAGFETELFPSITNEGFLTTLISALKDVEYDAVVINLPNEVDNLFCFPVMLESDVIFSVTTPNPIRVNEYRNMKKMLTDTPLNMEKWEVIMNQVGEHISKDVCDQLLRETSVITVPYDSLRPSHELDLRFGSPVIDQKMNDLAGMYGFLPPVQAVMKKKSMFGKKK